MSMRTMSLAFLILVAHLSMGCTPKACRNENLPAAKELKTPEQAVELFQYAFRHSCWETAHGLLTPKSQKEISESDLALIKWFPPNVRDVSIVDIIIEAKLKIVFPENPPYDGMMAKLAYPGINELFNLAVLQMPDDTWRIGLSEMLERGYLEAFGDELSRR